MPIYYKKVKHNSIDGIDLAERGERRFSFDFKNKLSSFNYRNYPKQTDDENINHGIRREDTSASPLISSPFTEKPTSSISFEEGGHLNEKLMTKYGPIVIVRQGATHPDSGKPIIMTYHDIGLNYSSNFESFFSINDNQLLLQSFCVFHINAPGQEENADNLPCVYTFPTMDQLAEQIETVCAHYSIKSFIGFGYGAGANVLSRFALANPDAVEGLFLVNPSSTTASWTEWYYQRRNIRQLQKFEETGLPPIVQDYMIWHLFGQLNTPDRVIDEENVNMYKRHFREGSINGNNLSLFIESYLKRTDLGISRESEMGNFKCNVVVVVGTYSPHIDESVKMNGRLNPKNSTWIKLSDCGMILEEQPQKLAQAFRLFLQGIGYTLKAFERKRALMSGASLPCIAHSSNITNMSAIDICGI